MSRQRAGTAAITALLSSVAALKSCVRRFLVTANAIPVAMSPQAKLPP
jgi:hypothetical protein